MTTEGTSVFRLDSGQSGVEALSFRLDGANLLVDVDCGEEKSSIEFLHVVGHDWRSEPVADFQEGAYDAVLDCGPNEWSSSVIGSGNPAFLPNKLSNYEFYVSNHGLLRVLCADVKVR